MVCYIHNKSELIHNNKKKFTKTILIVTYTEGLTCTGMALCVTGALSYLAVYPSRFGRKIILISH